MTLDKFMATREFEDCLWRLDIALNGDVAVGRAEFGRILFDLVEGVAEEIVDGGYGAYAGLGAARQSG